MLKLGDTVWLFDVNRRRYYRDNGRPIYEEHFTPLCIVGETRVSWLAKGEGHEVKLPKRQASGTVRVSISKGHTREVFLTRQDVLDDIWVNEHRMALVRLVQESRNPVLLREVAKLLGYAPEMKVRLPQPSKELTP